MEKTKTIVTQAMIAAMYTAVGLLFAPITYGSVQVRLGEALTLLPVFGFSNVWGVTIGCFITNMVGFFSGANILGSLDILFGTLATFLAAISTYFLRKFRIRGLAIPSAIPPIFFNAVIIGLELSYVMAGSFNLMIFIVQALSVGFGQLLSCGVMGVILVKIIEKNSRLCEILTGKN